VPALGEWLARGYAAGAPFTYVVDLDSVLWLAPRESEHVACAGGRDVLAAGEMAFARDGSEWVVAEVSNQSTGYCPDLDSWSAVAFALDRVGLTHPDGFTHSVVFRRCRSCGERNVVHDDDFTCAICGASLPAEWNFEQTT
jgi:hypothetical protein